MSKLIDHLIEEHKELKEIFEDYKTNPEENFLKLSKALSHHTTVEEAVLYPNARMFLAEETDHALEEHDQADELMDLLRQQPNNFEVFDKLRHAVEHHIAEEEGEYFPKCEEEFSQEKLLEMFEAASVIN